MIAAADSLQNLTSTVPAADTREYAMIILSVRALAGETTTLAHTVAFVIENVWALHAAAAILGTSSVTEDLIIALSWVQLVHNSKVPPTSSVDVGFVTPIPTFPLFP